MEVMQVLHMNKGDDETSYAKNSMVQSKIINIAKPIMEEAVLQMFCTNMPESIGIADLGCSSGPNTLLAISTILDIIHAKCSNLDRPSPELRVSLNDLPTNDFNYIFASLPEFHNRTKEEKGTGFGPCFISAVAGSFYGRLFPTRSLHFVHSSSSLHWLSQVPAALENDACTALNKGKIYISKNSPQCVLDAHSQQFKKDFSLFLKSRSEEIVPGGRMVLSFMSRRFADPTTERSCYDQWELLAVALMAMAREGIIEEEKVDSFNVPYYAPCPEELMMEIRKEGSFIVDRLELFEIDGDGDCSCEDNYANIATLGGEVLSSGQREAKTIRAVVESMLQSPFGKHVMDYLFRRYAELVRDHLSKSMTKYINLVISLTRKA